MAAEEAEDAERGEDESEEEDEREGADDGDDEADESESDAPAAKSDDDASDEEEEEEAEEKAADEEEPEEPAAKPDTKGKKKSKGKQALSAGARLAAAKAAKAARKAAKRGKDKQIDPVERMRRSAVAKRAGAVGDWAKQNRGVVLGIGAALVLGLAAWAGYTWWAGEQAKAAGALLAEAIEISRAEIREADSDPPAAHHDGDAHEERHYATEEARSRAALTAYRRVVSSYPSSDAATWARLGEGRTLLALGQNSQAREAFTRALGQGGDPQISYEALEGAAFSFEADEQWDRAISKYQEISSLAHGAYRPIARYHLGRMYLAKGDRARALETFRTLVEELHEQASHEGEEGDHEPAARQSYPYVLAQAEQRLHELDPSSAPAASLDSGNEPQLTPEQIQELIRRMQEQGGGAPGE